MLSDEERNRLDAGRQLVSLYKDGSPLSDRQQPDVWNLSRLESRQFSPCQYSPDIPTTGPLLGKAHSRALGDRGTDVWGFRRRLTLVPGVVNGSSIRDSRVPGRQFRRKAHGHTAANVIRPEEKACM